MGTMTLKELSKEMKGIDIAAFSTKTEGGLIATRPMSNNGDVEYDGDSWFFTYDASRTVSDIKADPKVSLGFQGAKSLLGKPGVAIAIQGQAELIHDRAIMEKHWVKDVEIYFEQGLDTPGVVLIKVRATRIHYWNGEDQGEIHV